MGLIRTPPDSALAPDLVEWAMPHGGIWLRVAARDTPVPLLAGPAAVFAPKLDVIALPAWVLLPYDR